MELSFWFILKHISHIAALPQVKSEELRIKSYLTTFFAYLTKLIIYAFFKSLLKNKLLLGDSISRQSCKSIKFFWRDVGMKFYHIGTKKHKDRFYELGHQRR